MSSTDAPAPFAFDLALERMARGWRGSLLAALVVVVSALPALIALPPLDRDESRFAEASAQMLESGDFVNIRFQGEARDKKPVGIHWMQAASVKLLSSVEKRQIWAYRIPSLLGAMLAAAACAWGAQAWFGARGGLIAGGVLGASLILSSEAFIGKTDAVLCGAVTLSMAALGRVYQAARTTGPPGMAAPGWRTLLLFWLGMALSIIDKGPIGPMVAALALLALWGLDRDIRWAGRLGWVWGVALVLLIVGPWAFAITVTTDGAFWGKAVGGDLAPKLAGGHESHGAWPGTHAILAFLLLFPASLILPAALTAGWLRRREAGVRFALAWLVPAWTLFELTPTKLVHYTLPTYGALAFLAAAVVTAPQVAGLGPRARWGGAVLSVLAGSLLATVAILAAQKYAGGASITGTALAAAVLCVAAGLAGAVFIQRGEASLALVSAGIIGIGAHIALSAGVAPHLDALWVSKRAQALLTTQNLDPRNGVTVGPVAAAGYAEPSLVFTLGAATELDSAEDAAASVAEGQPALVEARQDKAFRAALALRHTPAQPVGQISGFNYSIGKPVTLTLWKSLVPPAREPKEEDAP